MKKFKVNIIFEVEVNIDDTKFDDNFMREFRRLFYPFMDLQDHAKHLAQLKIRGFAENDDFVEGYGDLSDMGISMKVLDQEEEIVNNCEHCQELAFCICED